MVFEPLWNIKHFAAFYLDFSTVRDYFSGSRFHIYDMVKRGASAAVTVIGVSERHFAEREAFIENLAVHMKSHP